jgi:hypothetical protein
VRRLAAIVLSLCACKSVNPDYVKRARAELKRYEQGQRRMRPAPEPGSPVPLPWTKGQYAVWAVKAGDETTLTAAQVEEADTDGAILMITTLSPRLRTTARLTFRGQPHSRDEAKAMLTQVIRRREDGRAMTYKFYEGMRVDMRDSLEPVWGTLVPTAVQGAQPQTVATTAATLEGCQPATGTFLYTPLGLELEGWLHPGVPINGLALGKAKTGETVELVDMGWAGGAPNL